MLRGEQTVDKHGPRGVRGRNCRSGASRLLATWSKGGGESILHQMAKIIFYDVDPDRTERILR